MKDYLSKKRQAIYLHCPTRLAVNALVTLVLTDHRHLQKGYSYTTTSWLLYQVTAATSGGY